MTSGCVSASQKQYATKLYICKRFGVLVRVTTVAVTMFCLSVRKAARDPSDSRNAAAARGAAAEAGLLLTYSVAPIWAKRAASTRVAHRAFTQPLALENVLSFCCRPLRPLDDGSASTQGLALSRAAQPAKTAGMLQTRAFSVTEGCRVAGAVYQAPCTQQVAHCSSRRDQCQPVSPRSRADSALR